MLLVGVCVCSLLVLWWCVWVVKVSELYLMKLFGLYRFLMFLCVLCRFSVWCFVMVFGWVVFSVRV